MKKIKLVLTLIIASLFIWGVGKLYIAYNLSHYAGYYVQQLPRKKGTNPELAIILNYLDYIETPTTQHLSYDFDGNGIILLNKSVILSQRDNIHLWNKNLNTSYVYDTDGHFLYSYTDDIDNKNSKKQYEDEAQALLDKILPPILEAQPRPKINLQRLFNEKYYDRFN